VGRSLESARERSGDGGRAHGVERRARRERGAVDERMPRLAQQRTRDAADRVTLRVRPAYSASASSYGMAVESSACAVRRPTMRPAR
jgi:hypothetical protein